MPKRVFWPAVLVIMGLVFLAANFGMLPSSLWNLWPVILIIVGLGGLVTSDREEWMEEPTTSKTTKAVPKKAPVAKAKSAKKAIVKKTTKPAKRRK